MYHRVSKAHHELFLGITCQFLDDFKRRQVATTSHDYLPHVIWSLRHRFDLKVIEDALGPAIVRETLPSCRPLGRVLGRVLG